MADGDPAESMDPDPDPDRDPDPDWDPDPDPDRDPDPDWDPDPDRQPNLDADTAGTAGAAGTADTAGTAGAESEFEDATERQNETADMADDATDLPEDVIEQAERLTRLAREAVDEDERAAYRRERDALLDDHGEAGYLARVREDGTDTGATLVLYPGEWVDDGVVDVERVEDTDRAVERSLSGPGGGDWADVEAHNRAVADRVRADHGEVHGETAHAFADFMSNHYAKPIERATPGERREFREEYLPRNAWPTEAQLDRLERSLELIVETAESI